METPRLILKQGREKSLLRLHPWIFSGAVERLEGSPAKGETVDVACLDGRPIAKAAYSPESQILGRVWTFNPEEQVDDAFMARRVQAALSLRKAVFKGRLPDAYRLLNAESDGLPGAIADVYGKTAVCQFGAAGADRWKSSLAKAIAEAAGCERVYERGDIDSRVREGLPQTSAPLLGDEPPESIQIQEGACSFLVDVRKGHKTGFYLDQRENRRIVAEHAANAQEVLNCFSYTGGFGLAALKGGAAKALNLDLSADALALSKRNAELNGFDASRFVTMETDVFKHLRTLRDSRASFDMVVLDPPKFADSKNHVDKAARGYKDINLLAIKLIRPGGTLFTFSCSAAIDCELFQKIVASAALDARRELKFTEFLSQAPDHLVDSAFPEGRYLKGIVCQIA